MSIKKQKIAALVLAAGASNRLGFPKQLLPYNDATLLQHTVKQFNSDLVDRIYVVLGAHAKLITETIDLKACNLMVFRGWEEGMGASLAYACKRIFDEANFDGILITLVDIPLVEKNDYKQMVDLLKSGKTIVATQAKNQLGVPALFGSDYFGALQTLQGDKGAKAIIKTYSKYVRIYSNERAAFDIDTPESYKDLLNREEL